MTIDRRLSASLTTAECPPYIANKSFDTQILGRSLLKIAIFDMIACALSWIFRRAHRYQGVELWWRGLQDQTSD